MMRRWRAEFGEALGVPTKRRPGESNSAGWTESNAKRAGPTASTLVPIRLAQTKAASADQNVEIRLRGERTVIVSTKLDCGLLSRLIGAVERALRTLARALEFGWRSSRSTCAYRSTAWPRRLPMCSSRIRTMAIGF
jgi:hypothetical protein